MDHLGLSVVRRLVERTVALFERRVHSGAERNSANARSASLDQCDGSRRAERSALFLCLRSRRDPDDGLAQRHFPIGTDRFPRCYGKTMPRRQRRALILVSRDAFDSLKANGSAKFSSSSTSVGRVDPFVSVLLEIVARSVPNDERWFMSNSLLRRRRTL